MITYIIFFVSLTKTVTVSKSLQQCIKESLVTLPLPFCLSAESLSFFYIIDAYYKNSNPFQRTVVLKTIDFQMKFHDLFLCFQRVIFSCIKILQLNIVPSYC